MNLARSKRINDSRTKSKGPNRESKEEKDLGKYVRARVCETGI